MIALILIVEALLVICLIPWFGLMAFVVIAALLGRRGGGPVVPEVAGSSRFLFVIPAHDESAVIDTTVRSCLAVDYDPDRFQVFVIADNCTDDTARVAEAAGAQVKVRTDLDRKSKGFAFEDFFREATTNPAIRPFDAYILVDADTNVAPDLARAFDRALGRGADFVQGYYTVRNADASWRTRMITYAFSLANGVWLLGQDRLGLSVGLKGNGMCFRASALDRFPWRAHGLVEDMEFAWSLRIAGERVRFEPSARVFGEMVSQGGAGAASQRQRWETGRQALRNRFRRELWESSHLAGWRKLLYQVELAYPPLSRLVVGLGFVSIVAGSITAWKTNSVSLVMFALVAGCWLILGGYALSPIWTMKLPARYLLSLGRLPYYILWKLWIGRRKQPESWVRTPRESFSDNVSPR